jgi:hypothetical protein
MALPRSSLSVATFGPSSIPPPLTLFQQGQFQEHLPPRTVLGGTKWCVFKHPGEISRATVETAVRERMTRMRTRQLDFLQVCIPLLARLHYSPR